MTDIGSLITEETERRLAEMQRPDYEYPAKASVWDWLAIVVSVAVSVGLVALCMMGVIE